MGRRTRMSGLIKWEKSTPCRPVNNIVSSDFPKYNPQPWQFMAGEPCMSWLLSYEYQRKWIEERNAWNKKMYPENTVVNVDVVGRYIKNFKNIVKSLKQVKKKPFQMKKFQGAKSVIKHRRPPGDKAMKYLEKPPKN